MLEQLVLFCVKKLVLLDHSNNFGTIGVKMDGSAFEKKSVFSDAGTVIVSIAKTASRKIRAFICSVKLFSLEVALYLCKSTIRPCIEYCRHVWAGTLSSYLEMLYNLYKQVFKTVGPTLTDSLEL